MATTDRLLVLMTKDQKAKIAKRAKAANLTMGEFLRRAAFAYQPEQDEKALEGLIEQVKKTTRDAYPPRSIAPWRSSPPPSNGWRHWKRTATRTSRGADGDRRQTAGRANHGDQNE